MFNFDDMLNTALEAMPTNPSLGYIDYRDELSNDQVEAMIKGESLEEDPDFTEWIYMNKYESASYYVDDCMDHLRKEFADNEEASEWIDDNEDVIKEYLEDEAVYRDDTDLLHDLAANTPDVKLMIPLIGEDDTDWSDERKASQLMAALGTTDERYYWPTRNLIAEAPTDMGMAWVVFEASVVDIYEGRFKQGTIKITNPTVVYGNPFTGGVWDACYEGLTYHGDASTIMRDGSWGYTLDYIYGGFVFPYHNYEVSDEPLPATIDKESLEYMDVLGDYTMEVC